MAAQNEKHTHARTHARTHALTHMGEPNLGTPLYEILDKPLCTVHFKANEEHLFWFDVGIHVHCELVEGLLAAQKVVEYISPYRYLQA